MQNGVDHHRSHGSSDDAILSDKHGLTQTVSAITITPEQFEKVHLSNHKTIATRG